MRVIPGIAPSQCGVFATGQAFAAGWTPGALHHATVSGRLVRLRVGAYQVADLAAHFPELTSFDISRWQHAGPAIGAALVTSGALASHSTAAVLRGLPLLFIPRLPCVTVEPRETGAIDRVHVHRCTARPPSIPVGAVGCTSVALTCIDLAREHGVAAGTVALDCALHLRLTDHRRIYDDLDRCCRWPGVRRARAAIALSDGRSESVLETRSRLKLGEFGLPKPGLQVSIGNEWGRFVARVDFYWDEFGVVGEADGDVKYGGSEPQPLLAEKRRQSALEDLDLPVVRWGTADLHNFAPVAARLRRAFARGNTARRWTLLPDFASMR